MTRGGSYRHFGSKEELVAAAVPHAEDGVQEQVEEKPRSLACPCRGGVAVSRSSAHGIRYGSISWAGGSEGSA